MVRISKERRGRSPGFGLVRLVRSISTLLVTAVLCLMVVWSTLLNIETWGRTSSVAGAHGGRFVATNTAAAPPTGNAAAASSSSDRKPATLGSHHDARHEAAAEPAMPAIPRIMIFTYRENILETRRPKLLYDNVMNTINAYRTAWAGGGGQSPPKVQFLDDDACRERIRKAEPKLVKHFDGEKQGMYKADICRVAALYLTGGWYFDIDLQVIEPIHLDRNVTFVTANEREKDFECHGAGCPTDPKELRALAEKILGEKVYAPEGGNNFFQAFLAASPGHPVLKETLRIMLAYYEGKHQLHGFMGVSTLGDGYNAVDQSKRGEVRLLQEMKNAEGEKGGYYQNVPKQGGIGEACDFVVHDPETRIAYFYSRILGARDLCRKRMPNEK